jgi:hypothetical protein
MGCTLFPPVKRDLESLQCNLDGADGLPHLPLTKVISHVVLFLTAVATGNQAIQEARDHPNDGGDAGKGNVCFQLAALLVKGRHAKPFKYPFTGEPQVLLANS